MTDDRENREYRAEKQIGRTGERSGKTVLSEQGVQVGQGR
jgi:hypothetical protein